MAARLHLRIGLVGAEQIVEIDVPTADGEEHNLITITDGDGTLLAGLDFAADEDGPGVVLGHWPDGQEWVVEGGVAFPTDRFASRSDKVDRTLYSISLSDLEEYAGRPLTGEEEARFTRRIGEAVADAKYALLDAIGVSEACGCGPIPGVIAPMDTEVGVQRCVECGVYDGDLNAALALAARVNGTVVFEDSEGERRTYAGEELPEDLYIASETSPWVEVDGKPVDWTVTKLEPERTT